MGQKREVMGRVLTYAKQLQTIVIRSNRLCHLNTKTINT